MKEERLSLFNKVVFLEKENYECYKSKESLTLEVNNFKKELSCREKVSPKKNKKVKETTWSDFESSKIRSEFGWEYE